MARLPTAFDLGTVIPQGRRQAVSYNVVPTGGAEIGAAIQQAAGVVDQIQEKSARAEAEQAFNEFRKRENDLETGPDGFRSLRGLNAAKPEAFDPFKAKRKAAEDEIASKLSSRAQQAFRRATQSNETPFLNRINTWRMAQAEQADNEAFDGTLKTETALAASNWADPNAVKDSAASVRMAIASRELDGMPKEKADAIRMSALSSLHSGVVMSALQAKDIEYAKRYIQENDKEIADPRTRTVLHQALRAATIDDTADRIYSEIKTLPESEALKKIPSIEDREVRQRVKGLYEDFQDAIKIEKDQALNPARTLLADANLKSRIISPQEQAAIITPLMKTDPEASSKIAKEFYAHNEKVRTDRHQARARAEEAATSPDNYINYLRIRSDIVANPDAYRNIDPLSDHPDSVAGMYRTGKITKQQTADLANLISSAKNKSQDFFRLQSTDEYLNTRLREMTIDGEKFSSMNKKDQQKVKDQVLRSMDGYITGLQQSGWKATDSEVRNAIDSMFVEKIEKGRFRFSDKKVQEFQEAGAANRLMLRQIPAASRAAIEQRLKADGVPVTDENILKVWSAR